MIAAFTPTAEEWSALVLSLQVALGCVAVGAVPGVFMGWLLARRDFPGKLLLDAVVHLPLVLPPVVVGYVLLLLLGRNGAIGGWLEGVLGMPIAFTWRAAVIASAVMGFPLLVRSVRLAMELADRRLEEAARTLGSGAWRTFVTVTLPLALPGVATGLILAFARSLGEFGATITFAGNIDGQTRTLPLAVFTWSQTPGGDAPALRLVIISVVVSLVALALSEVAARRIRRRMDRTG